MPGASLGEQDTRLAGTLQGDVATAGRQLFHRATQSGFGANTSVHAVGGGARWIADQVKTQFGAQGSYLLDFYHVCDYLSAAAKAIVPEASNQKAWMEEQKGRLKTRRAQEACTAAMN